MSAGEMSVGRMSVVKMSLGRNTQDPVKYNIIYQLRF